jgi:predicted DCC family thiol-disulfide oxidoreductase YuxK
MIWVHPSSGGNRAMVLVRSAAALRVAWYLGGPWRFAALGWLVPRIVRDAAYNLIARHRYGLVRNPEQCFVPAPSVTRRFVDQTTDGTAENRRQ